MYVQYSTRNEFMEYSQTPARIINQNPNAKVTKPLTFTTEWP